MPTLRHVSDNGCLEPFSSPGSGSVSLEGWSLSSWHPGQRTSGGDVFIERIKVCVFGTINPDEDAEEQKRRSVEPQGLTSLSPCR